VEKSPECCENGGCDVLENPLVLHIVWKGLLVSPPDIPQWGHLGGRALGSSHVHPNVSVQQATLEHNDASGVHVAFDHRVCLNLYSFGRGNGSDNPAAKDDFFSLDVALNDTGPAKNDLPGTANRALHCSFDLERAGSFDIANDFQARCDH
jgi:hypothetical protein